MYARRLEGFWSTIFHGSLAAGKVAVAATTGFATGGPGGAIVAGGKTAAGEIQGATKGKSKGAQVLQPTNWLASLSNTDLALLTASGAALLLTLGGRRR